MQPNANSHLPRRMEGPSQEAAEMIQKLSDLAELQNGEPTPVSLLLSPIARLMIDDYRRKVGEALESTGMISNDAVAYDHYENTLRMHYERAREIEKLIRFRCDIENIVENANG